MEVFHWTVMWTDCMFQENLVVEGLSLLVLQYSTRGEISPFTCVHYSTDELLMLVAKNFERFQEDGRCYKQSVMTGHLASLRDKSLHGQFLQEIADKICVKSQWLWLQKDNFWITKEMEGLVLAAQE